MFPNLLQILHTLFGEYESETESTVIFRPEVQLLAIFKINLALSGQLPALFGLHQITLQDIVSRLCYDNKFLRVLK